jgi:hypothetical protein
MASWVQRMGAPFGAGQGPSASPQPNRFGQLQAGGGKSCANECACDPTTDPLGPTPPGSEGLSPVFYNWLEILH